jgi:hypothetical protein
MAQILEDWLNGEVKELSKLPVGDLSNTFFFRDPLAPILLIGNTFTAQLMEQLFTKKLYNQMKRLLK